MHSIIAPYDEAVHWKRNIFSVPSGNAGKSFVSAYLGPMQRDLHWRPLL